MNDVITWAITGDFEISVRCKKDAVAIGNEGCVDCCFTVREDDPSSVVRARIKFPEAFASPEHLQELAAKLKKDKRVRVIARVIKNDSTKLQLTHVAFDDGMRYSLTNIT